MAMTPEQKRALALASARLRLQQQQQPESVDPPQKQINAPGVMERFGRGLTDVASGLAKLAVESGYAPPPQVSIGSKQSQAAYADMAKVTPQGLAQTSADMEQEYQDRRGQNAGFDWARLAGNVTTALPTALIPGANTVAGSSALGAAQGLLQPSTKTGESYFKERAINTAIGGVAAGATTGLINKLTQPISPQTDDAVRFFMERGGTPTPGRMLGPRMAAIEERSAGLPVVGDIIRSAQSRTMDDFNRIALNETIAPINEVRAAMGEAVRTIDDVGRDGVNQTRKFITDSLDSAVAKMRFAPDEQFLADMSQIRGLTETMPEAFKSEFDSVIKNALDDHIKDGVVGGKTIQTVERSLNNLAKRYAQHQDPAKQELLGRAFSRVYDIFDGALERMNPGALPEYQAAKAAYARFIGIRNAANMAGSVEGRFTPDALASGLRRADTSAGRWRWAAGEGGAMQRLVEISQGIVPKIPNSGTAERMTGNIAGYGALGAAAVTNPVGTAAAAAPFLAYTRPGQEAFAAIFGGSRPQWMMGTGEALRRLAGPGGLAASNLATGANR